MKIKFHASCNFTGCDNEDEWDVPDDTTDKQLDDEAWAYALESIAPEGWWEKVEDEESEDE